MDFYVAGADDIRGYLVTREDLNLLFTAGHHFKGKSHTFHFDKPIPHRKLFVDSGGFQLFTKYKEYPFSTALYVLFIHDVCPDYFASLDYPCEPLLLQKNHSTVKGNIQKTVDKAIEIYDYEIDPDIQCVPVIQGWDVEDYLACVDLYKKQGLITDYMAVGTLCRRNQKGKIIRIIREVKRALGQNTRLHGFGVKIDILKEPETYRYLYSCDSASWVSQVAHGRICVFTGQRMIEIPYGQLGISPKERLAISLNGYVSFVEYLIKQNTTQNDHPLELFTETTQ